MAKTASSPAAGGPRRGDRMGRHRTADTIPDANGPVSERSGAPARTLPDRWPTTTEGTAAVPSGPGPGIVGSGRLHRECGGPPTAGLDARREYMPTLTDAAIERLEKEEHDG